CGKCGVRPFGKGGPLLELGGQFYAVNLGALDDATDEELAQAPIHYADGRNDAWHGEAKTRYLSHVHAAGKNRTKSTCGSCLLLKPARLPKPACCRKNPCSPRWRLITRNSREPACCLMLPACIPAPEAGG